ncbi:HAD family hydrolase [Petrocella sp. FN5]|uniref:HAD family hydrolase n=1 Tax=Petrocella sp. FN5 TaxID=3032002 RepID=UPI0023DB5783|nr:HAD family hydrolase [Petrocella sp. FN5]MDF1616271.1 HAD family hydrolase [Petrocella sp. FN5]
MENVMIIFDLDGTLVDSIEGLAYSMNLVLKANQLKTHSTETYFEFLGEGIERLVFKALPETHRDAALVTSYYKQMLASYNEHFDKDLVPYHGIYDMLDAFVDMDVKMVIHTNKNERMAKIIVEHHLGQYDFLRLIGDDGIRKRKPDYQEVMALLDDFEIQKNRCFFVGDTEIDVQTAQAAGVPMIAVSWGFRKPEVLKALNPTYLVNKPEEIVDIVRKVTS